MNYRANNLLIVVMFILAITTTLFSQSNDAGKLNDENRINLIVYVPHDSALIEQSSISQFSSVSLKEILEKKIRSLINRDGFSGASRSPRFMITPDLVLVDREYLPTAPAKVLITLELNLYIADFLDKRTFAHTSMKVHGVGATETEALRGALNQIQHTSLISNFLREGKSNILRYYNDQCDFVLEEARMLSQTGRYDLALDLLFQVPQACSQCYRKAMEMLPVLYRENARIACEKNLQLARVSWASKVQITEISRQGSAQRIVKDEEGIEDAYGTPSQTQEPSSAGVRVDVTEKNDSRVYEALVFLRGIFPHDPCYPEAQELLDEIKAHVNQDLRIQEERIDQFIDLERYRFEKAVEVIQSANETQAELFRLRQADEARTAIILNR